MREKKVPVSVLLPEHVDNCIKELAKEKWVPEGKKRSKEKLLLKN